MKTTVLTMLTAGLLALMSLSSGTACEIPQHSITLQSRLNTPTISTNGGIAYLQLTITTPSVGIPHRRPLNLSVVLDRSGSMGDEGKIDYAKKAIWKLVDQLNSEDILSIVIYDDIVDILRPAQPVGRNKYAIKHLIDEVYPRGSTNLGGGMVEGLRQVEHFLSTESVNRVVLLSDGLANQGITDPEELDRIARKYRAKCISLTTMGVGLDYNENLMVGLSKNGGGNYYFIESPNSLASIMSREFNMLSTVAAQNASIELTLGRNVVVRDVIGCEYHPETGRTVVPVGDLYSNECREFTVELSIPEGSGSFAVATGTLRFESNQHWSDGFPRSSAMVRYTRDIALIDKGRDLNVQAKADVAVSTRTVENAMKALDEGKDEEAAGFLQQAQDVLHASPAASMSGAGGAEIRQQSAKLNSYEKLLKDSTGDGRKAKKSIQYDNYRTQKSK
jgi:Ca-activated chloride channel homolog